jgi:hypothetical protein
MDVMIAYLYGSLDSDIYMKVPDGISVPNTNVGHNMYRVNLNKSLYDLKQFGRIWYNRLKEFLLNKGYSNNDDVLMSSFANPQLDFALFQYMLMI